MYVTERKDVMKKMIPKDVLVTSTLGLKNYFSNYDLAYAFECREADIVSILDGYRDGWDDSVTQFAQDVISKTELSAEGMLGLLSRVSCNNPSGNGSTIEEAADRNLEFKLSLGETCGRIRVSTADKFPYRIRAIRRRL